MDALYPEGYLFDFNEFLALKKERREFLRREQEREEEKERNAEGLSETTFSDSASEPPPPAPPLSPPPTPPMLKERWSKNHLRGGITKPAALTRQEQRKRRQAARNRLGRRPKTRSTSPDLLELASAKNKINSLSLGRSGIDMKTWWEKYDLEGPAPARWKIRLEQDIQAWVESMNS